MKTKCTLMRNCIELLEAQLAYNVEMHSLPEPVIAHLRFSLHHMYDLRWTSVHKYT